MKVDVPPPPAIVESEAPKRSRVSAPLVEAFDAGFVGRIIISMLGVGALSMLGVLGATHSATQAGSFGGGVLMGALLLKSQDIFIRRVLGPRAEGEKSLLARAPLAVIMPLKYIAVGAAMGVLMTYGGLQPIALAAGFIVGQIVIVAKVVGRFLALKARMSEKQTSSKSSTNFRTYVA
jgi:hypothetical protein